MVKMEWLSDADARSDEFLVQAMNEGDVSAFEAIYYRYRDWVVRLAYRFTANREDALDVLQDTFAYLLGKFPGFRLSARMTTFLYPVVRNLSLAMLRKRKRYVSDAEIAQEAAARSAERGSFREELSAIVSALPEKQREVLLMRFVDGMSLEEIAQALKIPVGTVKSRLHHALRTLRTDERTRGYFLG